MFENNPLVIIFAFVIVLTPLILVHELGHFIAAKLVGITILEFGLGFPPRVRKLFTWRKTEFTLNWIPLGGFVRPLGEDVIRPLDEKAVEHDRQDFLVSSKSTVAKSVSETSPLQRIFFMAAGAFANFLLAFILFILVALIGIQEVVASGIQVVDINPTSILGQSGLQNDDVVIEVEGMKFANVDEFFQRLYQDGNASVKIGVLRGLDNQKIELTIPSLSELDKGKLLLRVQVREVNSNSPASTAGIKAGDIIIKLNGTDVQSVDNFREQIRENLGKSINLTIDRQDDVIDVALTPRINYPQGQGALGVKIAGYFTEAALGLNFAMVPQIEYVPQTFTESVQYGFENVIGVISSIVELPTQLMNGTITPQEARPVSVLGISQIGAVFIEESITQQNVSPILLFIATISVGLGFFNLLPIPALDGGRILFVVIELVRGKPISPEREGLVHLIGLALLLSLSVLVLLNDVINPVTNGLP